MHFIKQTVISTVKHSFRKAGHSTNVKIFIASVNWTNGNDYIKILISLLTKIHCGASCAYHNLKLKPNTYSRVLTCTWGQAINIYE